MQCPYYPESLLLTIAENSLRTAPPTCKGLYYDSLIIWAIGLVIAKTVFLPDIMLCFILLFAKRVVEDILFTHHHNTVSYPLVHSHLHKFILEIPVNDNLRCGLHLCLQIRLNHWQNATAPTIPVIHLTKIVVRRYMQADICKLYDIVECLYIAYRHCKTLLT